MARKNVMLKDSNGDILDAQTNVGQVKDSNGDMVMNANPTTKIISWANNYTLDGEYLKEGSVTAGKIADGVIPEDLADLNADSGHTTVTVAEKDQITTNQTDIAGIQAKIPQDASAQNLLATEDYVDENGGKIDIIKIDGTTQPITNKEVNLPAYPTVESLGAEVTANKRTSTQGFQNVPDDTHYASEKLVKDSLDLKADLVGGKVPAAQLPSYVDDVEEYNSFADFPVEGEAGKIYIALDTNYTYRWSGSTYVQIGGMDEDPLEVEDITALTTAQINELNCGNIVLKNINGNKHTYVVTYKENSVGICLTYSDAENVETVSYDCVNEVWTYNSTDHTNISGKEDKSNKVSAFQETPDNIHYPSEKLVKDSFDDNTTMILTEEDITTGDEEADTEVYAQVTVDGDNITFSNDCIEVDGDDITINSYSTFGTSRGIYL